MTINPTLKTFDNQQTQASKAQQALLPALLDIRNEKKPLSRTTMMDYEDFGKFFLAAYPELDPTSKNYITTLMALEPRSELYTFIPMMKTQNQTWWYKLLQLVFENKSSHNYTPTTTLGTPNNVGIFQLLTLAIVGMIED
jgi:hypothetical protein